MLVFPTAEDFVALVASNEGVDAPNVYPVYSYFTLLDLTPHIAYLKLTDGSAPLFLFESAKNGDQVDRYLFMGVAPRLQIRTGPGHGEEVDPLTVLEKEMLQFRQADVPGVPRLSGGAIGYVLYDCIKYFEPKTRRPLKDVLQLPELALMLFDTIVAFDHVFQRFQVITNVKVERGTTPATLRELHAQAGVTIKAIADLLLDSAPARVVPQGPIVPNQQFTLNVGQEGYEQHVLTLKKHILAGDIIQAVPLQRMARPTLLHPFNIYRHLRTVNPLPYLFYIDYVDFQVVGALPELLVKCDANSKIITHPIAGTVPRGKTLAEDDELAQQLKLLLKDRAEHVMLVDLARNDVNRVCDPATTSVDRLLTVERFLHVMHLVSEVLGTLRSDKSRFDAFRSIFPAGTVSGAPKVKAMELVLELEGEKRGVYAGAVGHWLYDGKTMDTCIALRTMVVKDGVAYLQAGGGIVFDSDPTEEYVETMNKMGANIKTIADAEAIWAAKQA